jgi:hypothetical protein
MHSESPTLNSHHDNSRSAKAALGPVHLGNALLHGMWLLCVPDAFDCDDMLAINTDQWCQTSIDRGMVYFLRCGVILRDDLAQAHNN